VCHGDFPCRQKTSYKVLQLAKDAKDKLRSAAVADQSAGTSVSSNSPPFCDHISHYFSLISIFLPGSLVKIYASHDCFELYIVASAGL
jgi:hypothetical protein